MVMNKMPMNNMAMNKMPMNNMAMNKMPMNKMPMNNMVMNNMVMNKIAMNKTGIENRLDSVLENMPGCAKYAVSSVKQLIGTDVVDGVVDTVTRDNNMIPIGILIIMLSIILFFIDASS